MNNKQLSLVSLGVVALGSLLNAADGFVLFGDDVAKPAPEQKFVRPMTGPYFHEDAFITTDLRAWYLQHNFDSDTLGSNADVTVAALQVRIALTESLQLVAYKDGYTEFDNAALVGDNEGFNDIGAGIKWAFIQDWENNFHMAAGIGYEFGLGDKDVLQETNELRLWLSWAKGFDKLHLGATANLILSEDDSDGFAGNSDMVTVHLHADYYLTEWLSPVVELNGYLAQDAAPGLPISGVDAVSLPGGEANDTYTIAVGAEVRPFCENFGLRLAYETELTDNVSLFGDRWTLSAVYEF
ncbi:MAG: hypothetical protein NWT02_04645 [Opitutales bacterium]|jgi:hypothetical protein|nr:hypothetical protein [Opitutales bacterium]MDP4644133.1 hypothetical protein [Opitutales bacterium]MDP4694276.1 hypothetical protein [Opitutales bacterium]MDP4778569.1 hypothetical protein [Opitutales bacterium]MDP4878774.1 hypothetical protein [Opitutales bacterium]